MQRSRGGRLVRINRSEWPDSGPHLAFLEYLDNLHDKYGQKSYERLNADMGRITQGAGLAPSRILHILRGRSLPTGEKQVRLLVLAMAGRSDDATAVEVEKAIELFTIAQRATYSTTSADTDGKSGDGTRRRWITAAMIGVLGLLVLMGGLILFLLKPVSTWNGPVEEGVSASNRESGASSGASLTGNSSGGLGCIASDSQAVSIVLVSPDDGKGGVAKYNTLTVDVRRNSLAGHTYWLMVHVLGGQNEDSPYFAKQQIVDNIGTQRVALQLDSAVGSTREVFVVEADADGTAILRKNHDLPMDGSRDRDPSRINPPPGQVVSGTCQVTKTRDQP
jgi:hypothetical protein